MAILWILILVSCVVVEICTVALVSIWFSAAAGLALIALKLGAGAAVQVVIFIIGSVVGMFIFKNIWKTKLKDRKIPTNFDRYIGQEFAVVETVDAYTGKGAIAINGQIWTAKSIDETEKIEKGSMATLKKIEGSLAYISIK